MSSAQDPRALEEKLGYTFSNRELLIRALTHKSYAFEQFPGSELIIDNEQLEFLGDSILGFVVSETMMAKFPLYREGDLSRLKAHLVSAAHLYFVAARLGTGDFLQLGRSEEVGGGRKKKALLANSIEALIAAMYLDGGLEPVRDFIHREVVGSIEDLERQQDELTISYKTVLQERARALNLPSPMYVVAAENGPEHAKTFVVEVRVGKEYASRGEGPSKKSAGQNAAKAVLEKMKADDPEAAGDTL